RESTRRVPCEISSIARLLLTVILIGLAAPKKLRRHLDFALCPGAIFQPGRNSVAPCSLPKPMKPRRIQPRHLRQLQTPLLAQRDLHSAREKSNRSRIFPATWETPDHRCKQRSPYAARADRKPSRALSWPRH